MSSTTTASSLSKNLNNRKSAKSSKKSKSGKASEKPEHVEYDIGFDCEFLTPTQITVLRFLRGDFSPEFQPDADELQKAAEECRGVTEEDEYQSALSGWGYVQKPVSSQFYLHNVFGLDYEGVKALLNKRGYRYLRERLLGVRVGIIGKSPDKYGTTLIIDSRGIEAGEDYAQHYALIIKFITKEIYHCDKDTRYTLNLWTLYSNAELANIFPDRDVLREIIRKQCSKTKLVSIQKTLFVEGYRYLLPGNISCTFRDVRHLFYKPSLKALGEQIGIHKLAHPDWEKENADMWIQRDLDGFLDYCHYDALIPCVAALGFMENRNQFICELSEKGYIPPIENPSVQKLLKKRSVTAASISDALAKLFLQNIGKWEAYKEFTLDLEKDHLPEGALYTTGGLNKNFISDRPTWVSGVDIYDISSAYLNRIRTLQIPISPPKSFKSEWINKRVKASVVAKELDDVAKEAVLKMSWFLPYDSTEWQRSIVAYVDGNGCTLACAEKQWVTLVQLLAFAEINPDAEVVIHEPSYIWDDESEFISLGALMDAIQELRTKYKKEWKKTGDLGAYLMQDTIKLIGNGLVGKLGQHKDALDPDLLYETLNKGGLPSKTANGKPCTASITNRVVFNLVTGGVRAYIALAAWINKGMMCVTDSMVVEHGKWINPATYVSRYKNLNRLLSVYTWEKEHDNSEIFIFKERDYVVFKLLDESKRPLLEQSVTECKCLIELPTVVMNEDGKYEQVGGDVVVTKAAKRGWVLPKEYSNLPIKEAEQWGYIRFFQDGFERLSGKPYIFNKVTLTSANEMLCEGKKLNDRSERRVAIGSHNYRYQCLDETEFRTRILQREKAKRFTYEETIDGVTHVVQCADMLHLKIVAPDRCEQVIKNCKPKPHQPHNKNRRVHRALALLHLTESPHYSHRRIALHTGIPKSTVQRYVKAVVDSNIKDELWKEWGSVEVILEFLEKEGIWKPSCSKDSEQLSHFSSGGDDPQDKNGTPHNDVQQTPVLTTPL